MAEEKEFAFDIIAKFRDEASKDVKKFHAEMVSSFRSAGKNVATGWSGSFGQSFGKSFGGGGLGSSLMGQLGTRPGGIGGFVSDLGKTAGGLLTIPMRVLGAFSALIPGVGLILGGVIGSAANILSGLIGIAANIAGMVVNVMAAVLSRLIGAVEWIVGAVAGVLGKILKVAAGIGLGAGAAIAFALYKGVQENFQEAQLKAVLKRRLGGAVDAAWAEIERVKRTSPFGAEELADAMTVLARGDLESPAQYLQVIADAATGAKMGLEEVATLFLKIASGEKGAGEAQRTMKLLGFSETQIAGIRNAADLAAVLKQRFGGINEEVARLDPVHRIMQQIKDSVRDLSAGLAEGLLPKLNALADWMTRFRASPEFAKLKDWITEAGAAVMDKLMAGLNWLETRDWTWANFKTGLSNLVGEAKKFGAQLLDLIAFKDSSGKLSAGPLVLGLVAAFEYAGLEIEKVFRELWIRVGNTLVNTLLTAMAGLGQSMKSARIDAVNRAVMADKGWTPQQWAAKSPAEQVAARESYGMHHLGLSLAQAPLLLAENSLIAAGKYAPKPLGPEDIAARTAALEVEMAPQLAAAASKLAAAQTAAGQMMPSGAGLAQAAANILPAKAPTASGAPFSSPGGSADTPEEKALRGRVEGAGKMVEAFRKNNRPDLMAKALDVLEALATQLELMKSEDNDMAHRMDRVEKTVNRLAVAR